MVVGPFTLKLKIDNDGTHLGKTIQKIKFQGYHSPGNDPFPSLSFGYYIASEQSPSPANNVAHYLSIESVTGSYNNTDFVWSSENLNYPSNASSVNNWIDAPSVFKRVIGNYLTIVDLIRLDKIHILVVVFH